MNLFVIYFIMIVCGACFGVSIVSASTGMYTPVEFFVDIVVMLCIFAAHKTYDDGKQ
jgi:hypothetical protein